MDRCCCSTPRDQSRRCWRSSGVGLALRRDPWRALWLLAFPLPFLLFIAGTFPASRYLVPVVPFMAVFAAIAVTEIWRRQRLAAHLLFVAAFATAGLESLRTGAFIRQTDTRTLALDYIRTAIPPGATILTQPYSVPLEPTADVLREAVSRSGKDMPTKTRLQIAREPVSGARLPVDLPWTRDGRRQALPAL